MCSHPRSQRPTPAAESGPSARAAVKVATPSSMGHGMSAVTHDPRQLSTDELDVDIALARQRVIVHSRCGRRPTGEMQCQFGRDAVAEQDELLEARLSRG